MYPRHLDREPRAASRLGLHLYRVTQNRRRASHDRQAEPHTVTAGVNLRERVEGPLLHFCCEADTHVESIQKDAALAQPISTLPWRVYLVALPTRSPTMVVSITGSVGLRTAIDTTARGEATGSPTLFPAQM